MSWSFRWAIWTSPTDLTLGGCERNVSIDAQRGSVLNKLFPLQTRSPSKPRYRAANQTCAEISPAAQPSGSSGGPAWALLCSGLALEGAVFMESHGFALFMESHFLVFMGCRFLALMKLHFFVELHFLLLMHLNFGFPSSAWCFWPTTPPNPALAVSAGSVHFNLNN